AIRGNPEQQTTAAIAPGSGTGISLYYHYEGDTVSTVYPINTIQSRYFNQVESDRSGTPTETITETNTAYELPGNLIGSKAGVGLAVMLDTDPISDFLDTLENITFNQFTLEMGPLENFADTRQPIQNLIIYFVDENNNKIMKRSDGRDISVQGERQPQIQGRDADGNIVPAVDNPTTLIFNKEKFTYNQQITSYINAVYRAGLPRTDLILYPTATTGSGDEFKQSLREYIVDKRTVKLKIYYSKVK